MPSAPPTIASNPAALLLALADCKAAASVAPSSKSFLAELKSLAICPAALRVFLNDSALNEKNAPMAGICRVRFQNLGIIS